MECENYLVMKCIYIIQINLHFLSLYLVIFKNAVLPVLFLQRFAVGVTGISVSRTSIVFSSTVLLGKNICSKDTSNKSKDETSFSEHNLDWDNFS
jgi:hypothetical protein